MHAFVLLINIGLKANINVNMKVGNCVSLIVSQVSIMEHLSSNSCEATDY